MKFACALVSRQIPSSKIEANKEQNVVFTESVPRRCISLGERRPRAWWQPPVTLTVTAAALSFPSVYTTFKTRISVRFWLALRNLIADTYNFLLARRRYVHIMYCHMATIAGMFMRGGGERFKLIATRIIRQGWFNGLDNMDIPASPTNCISEMSLLRR